MTIEEIGKLLKAIGSERSRISSWSDEFYKEFSTELLKLLKEEVLA